MDITMSGGLAAAYRSASQRARVVTEAWGETNLYCPNCPSPQLSRLPHNTKGSDYRCRNCGFLFQLKGRHSCFGKQIPDGAYSVMIEAIRRDETPNFYFMQYSAGDWRVKNLLLVPGFAFSESAIVKRKPLGPHARRAGWIGCNIALGNVPEEARIKVVVDGEIVRADEVRNKFRRISSLKAVSIGSRGWTLEVLVGVRQLERTEFTTEEAYSLVPKLEELHPNNRHVREKIRQQLQVLRDSGLLIHVGRGRWRIPALG
jgi:type II restriction enzyme